MKNLPPRDRRAVGDSLFSNHEREVWKKILSPRSRELVALERTFHAERARLIKPAEHRAAVKLIREFEANWQRMALKAGSDLDRRKELKRAAGKKLEQQLSRAIPGFRAYIALKKKYLKERGKLVHQVTTPAGVAGLKVHLGALMDPISVDTQEFVAPFPRSDVMNGDLQGALRQDDSYALPETGQLVQSFVFEHDESSWGVSSRSVFVDQLTSCGVDFTMPTTGRLQFSAELENFANRLDCSISDNFGFSHSYLTMTVHLFIAIVRAGLPKEYHYVELISSELKSEGDDLARSISDLPTFEPYGVGGVTLSTLPAGETVTILAGAHVRVDSDTDDMDAHVRSTYWWHMRKLAIAVI